MRINFTYFFLLFLMWLLEKFKIIYVSGIAFLLDSTKLPHDKSTGLQSCVVYHLHTHL